MAESVEGEGFWLPAEFLTDDDILLGKESFSKTYNSESQSELCFPAEFPYHFETERKQIPEKLRLMSTSPQSTLTRFGSAGGSSNVSPNSATSAPKAQVGSKYDVVGDLVYRAAGQVVKLKLNNGDGFGFEPTRVNGRIVAPRSHAQFYPASENLISSVCQDRNFQQQNHQNDCCGMWYSQQRVYQNRGGRTVGGGGQTAWNVQQNPSRGRAVSAASRGGGGGGAAAKRGCAGTGVFLPRRYGNNNDSNAYSSDSHNETGCSTALFHSRAAAHYQINNLDNISAFPQSLAQSQPRINRGFVPHYNPAMVRRHATVLQERQRLLNSLIEGSSMISHDHFLPQDWSY